MSQHTPIKGNVCPRCDQELYPAKQDIQPLELDWEEVHSEKWITDERGYFFVILKMSDGLRWEVYRDDKVLYMSSDRKVYLPEHPNRFTFVNFAIHEWYTKRFSQFVRLKEEFDQYNTFGF